MNNAKNKAIEKKKKGEYDHLFEKAKKAEYERTIHKAPRNIEKFRNMHLSK